MKFRTSLEGKLAVLAVLIAWASVGITTLALEVLPFWLALPLALLMVMMLALTLARGFIGPVANIIDALVNSIQNFSDRDFSITITENRQDELGELVRSHNQVGEVLREERHNLYQRELLLETVFESVPVALVLTDEVGHILLSNVAARHLLASGRRLEGTTLDSVSKALPPRIVDAIRDETSGLVTLDDDGDVSTYYLQTQRFGFNNREQRLLQIRDMTRELRREEVAVWKKVIRVISHELNNSLAPITSLAHSGQLALDKRELALLSEILSTIGERADHLKAFIEGYARFARLPHPARVETPLGEWLERLALELNFTLRVDTQRPTISVDPGQLGRVIISLVGNAHEAEPGGIVEVTARDRGTGITIGVRDHGPGMSAEVIRNALLPFYSTKQQGTGLGLALCREIVEGHDGTLQLTNHRDGGLEVSIHLPEV